MRQRRTSITILGAVLAVAVAACGDPGAATPEPTPPVERPTPGSPHVDDLAAGLGEVGYDLFHYAAGQSDADVVLSPLSIGIAFGMADAGATGDTAEVLADLFAYPVEGEARRQAFNTLEQSVTNVGEPVVRLANREFPDEGFSTAEGYDETLARWFGAGIEPLPLRADPEGSREHINAWVSEQTEELIPELLPVGFVRPNSVMVLVNALYLEADWARQFGKYPTSDAEFTRLDGSTVTVPLMHELELSGPAVATGDYAATEIPYEDGELSMLVIVPAEGRYHDVERRFGSDLVAEIDAAGTQTSVELWLPRFESESTLDLRAAIEDGLGVEGLFGAAGWDGIADGITLESAVHAADIAVDEYGTIAAAATGLGFEESGPPEPEVVVRADRPFLYLIRHVGTGAVLFVGRVLDPSATA
jgi:serpin B